MAKPSEPRLKVGDRVKIRYLPLTGRIVELLGPLAPGGVQVYRVRIRRRPRPSYTELREDHLKLLPPKPKPKAAASAKS